MNEINLDSIRSYTLFLRALKSPNECVGASVWKSYRALGSKIDGYGKGTGFSSFDSTNPLLINDGNMSLYGTSKRSNCLFGF